MTSHTEIYIVVMTIVHVAIARHDYDIVNECASFPCRGNATCTDHVGHFTCRCGRGFTGTFCEDDVDECASNPCHHYTVCIDTIDFYKCSCERGFYGINCDLDIDECVSMPCQNQGQCFNMDDWYYCECKPGYAGQRCEQDLNECFSSPCEHAGSCTDCVNAFNCTCPSGFHGDTCQIEANECLSMPCAHGGNCTDLLDSFTCVCVRGYRGNVCQTEVNECGSHPCMHGASCIDRVNRYQCACELGFSGVHCDRVGGVCAEHPCKNLGHCEETGRGGYVCNCTEGYSGSHCELHIGRLTCESGFCLNQATCKTVDHYGPHCTCAAGYTGRRCEIQILEYTVIACIAAMFLFVMIGVSAYKCGDKLPAFTLINRIKRLSDTEKSPTKSDRRSPVTRQQQQPQQKRMTSQTDPRMVNYAENNYDMYDVWETGNVTYYDNPPIEYRTIQDLEYVPAVENAYTDTFATYGDAEQATYPESTSYVPTQDSFYDAYGSTQDGGQRFESGQFREDAPKYGGTHSHSHDDVTPHHSSRAPNHVSQSAAEMSRDRHSRRHRNRSEQQARSAMMPPDVTSHERNHQSHRASEQRINTRRPPRNFNMGNRNVSNPNPNATGRDGQNQRCRNQREPLHRRKRRRLRSHGCDSDQHSEMTHLAPTPHRHAYRGGDMRTAQTSYPREHRYVPGYSMANSSFDRSRCQPNFDHDRIVPNEPSADFRTIPEEPPEGDVRNVASIVEAFENMNKTRCLRKT